MKPIKSLGGGPSTHQVSFRKTLKDTYIYIYIGVRGSLERDISSLRAFGPGVGQISRVVHVSARAPFGVFAEKYGFV